MTMIGRIITALFMVTAVFGVLIDNLPARYCTRIDYPGTILTIQTRHVVTFWNETTMEYRQYNSRKGLPWWEKRCLRDITMHYNECADAPQPYVMDYNFKGFGFTKEQFAAMLHHDINDTLEVTIFNGTRYLERCPGPWDRNIRKKASTASSD